MISFTFLSALLRLKRLGCPVHRALSGTFGKWMHRGPYNTHRLCSRCSICKPQLRSVSEWPLKIRAVCNNEISVKRM